MHRSHAAVASVTRTLLSGIEEAHTPAQRLSTKADKNARDANFSFLFSVFCF
jgi:hypothetical protein